MAKRKSKNLKCKKGWFPVEIEIGKKKTIIVCGRVPTEAEKKKSSKASKWIYGGLNVLDVAGSILQAIAHH